MTHLFYWVVIEMWQDMQMISGLVKPEIPNSQVCRVDY